MSKLKLIEVKQLAQYYTASDFQRLVTSRAHFRTPDYPTRGSYSQKWKEHPNQLGPKKMSQQGGHLVVILCHSPFDT